MDSRRTGGKRRRRTGTALIALLGIALRSALPALHNTGDAAACSADPGEPPSAETVLEGARASSVPDLHDCGTCPVCRQASGGVAPLPTGSLRPPFGLPVARTKPPSHPLALRAGPDLSSAAPRAPPFPA